MSTHMPCPPTGSMRNIILAPIFYGETDVHVLQERSLNKCYTVLVLTALKCSAYNLDHMFLILFIAFLDRIRICDVILLKIMGITQVFIPNSCHCRKKKKSCYFKTCFNIQWKYFLINPTIFLIILHSIMRLY